MTKQEILNLIQQEVPKVIKETLMADNNLVVPRHQHNGVDSPQIPIKNILIVPGTGLPLQAGNNFYNFYIDPVDYNLTLIPNATVHASGNADFYIGFSSTSTVFNNVYINSDESFQTSVIDGTDTNVFLQIPAVTNNAVADVVGSATEQLTTTGKNFTATGVFALSIPAATLPASPATGMFAVKSTAGVANFRACVDGSTFHYVPTSDASTSAAAAAAGAIKVRINGTDYNLLYK